MLEPKGARRQLMDQCSAARPPISATGTLTNQPGRDLALEVDKRFSYPRRSPAGGSVNSVPPNEGLTTEGRCSGPISSSHDLTPGLTARLLRELDAGRKTKLGVDVGEV